MVANFTPLSAAAGGVLIGTATVGYRWLAGRYAGISGIARGAVFGDADRQLDALFIAGLLSGGFAWFWIFGPRLLAVSQTPLIFAAAGGLLVGFGTRLGGGCTSGHGVCGLARRSLPSFVAVCVFLATGVATVFVLHRNGLL